jgi:hypothetical protein
MNGWKYFRNVCGQGTLIAIRPKIDHLFGGPGHRWEPVSSKVAGKMKTQAFVEVIFPVARGNGKILDDNWLAG